MLLTRMEKNEELKQLNQETWKENTTWKTYS
jgi:hypothetical protein